MFDPHTVGRRLPHLPARANYIGGLTSGGAAGFLAGNHRLRQLRERRHGHGHHDPDGTGVSGRHCGSAPSIWSRRVRTRRHPLGGPGDVRHGHDRHERRHDGRRRLHSSRTQASPKVRPWGGSPTNATGDACDIVTSAACNCRGASATPSTNEKTPPRAHPAPLGDARAAAIDYSAARRPAARMRVRPCLSTSRSPGGWRQPRRRTTSSSCCAVTGGGLAIRRWPSRRRPATRPWAY